MADNKFILTDDEVRTLAIDFARTVASRKTTPQKRVQEFFNQIDTFLEMVREQNEERKEPPGELEVFTVDAP